MKTKARLLILVLLCALALTACSGDQNTAADFPDINQSLEPTAAPQVQTQQQAGVSVFEQNPYDVDIPADDYTEADIYAEEDESEADAELVASNVTVPQWQSAAATATAVPASTVYPYAGSSPIPLDPIDMPTPTPRPKLSFTYGTFASNALGVSFEAPSNWSVDQSQTRQYILTEPASSVKEGQACIITVYVEPITKNYTEKELKSYVKTRFNEMEHEGGYSSWSNTSTASRHLMGANGVYANYTATTDGGVQVGGRIIYACSERTLYGIEIIFPKGYTDDYIEVFNQVRSTMKSI